MKVSRFIKQISCSKIPRGLCEHNAFNFDLGYWIQCKSGSVCPCFYRAERVGHCIYEWTSPDKDWVLVREGKCV